MTTINIAPDPAGKAWLNGLGVGRNLAERIAADEHLSKATHEEQLAWFWLYVGTAAHEKDITEDTMMRFVQAAAMEAPQRRDEFVLTFSTKGLTDPDMEPDPNQPDPLGVEIAHILRNVRDQIVGIDPGETEGPVFGGPDGFDQVGSWKVHL